MMPSPQESSKTTDEAAFQSWLDAHPDDHHARLVFADWLDERDDPRGPGYRALGVNRKRPFIPEESDFCPWFSGGFFNSHGEAEDLPCDWFSCIELEGKAGFFAPDHDYRRDAIRREVEDAAALAFSRLPPERQAELLAGSLLLTGAI